MSRRNLGICDHHDEDVLRSRAARFVNQSTKVSKVLSVNPDTIIPRFDVSELTLGREIGRGGFGRVIEVRRVHLNGNDGLDFGSIETQHDNDDVVLQDRKFIAMNYTRQGGNGTRYVIKTPITNLDDPVSFVSGIIDIAMEARFLAFLRHPHIIKMRAISNVEFCQDNYFIMLDRLYDTLNDRLITWKNRKKKTNGLHIIRDRKVNEKKELWKERILVAQNVCSALAYLHHHRIVYRDLKPENIGFDFKGDVKLFDFGLAKELTDEKNKVGHFLSGRTGSLRYMAPEVAKEEPYNETVDVYSFSILLWQICSLKTPFADNNVETHYESVIQGDVRPDINLTWPTLLSTLMTKGWSIAIEERPDCNYICKGLQSVLDACVGVTESE